MSGELALTNYLVLELNPLPTCEGDYECRRIMIFRVKIGGLRLAAFCAVLFLFVPVLANAQVLGEKVTFNLEKSFDHNDRSSISATLYEVGTYSLIYIEDVYYNGLSVTERSALLSSADVLRSEFDTNVYPKLTAFYGSPWEPGIDNDVRVTLLLTQMQQNAGGYFDTGDEFTKQQSPTSNEREMLYLNAVFYSNPRRLHSFVAHEFTHLIDFNQKRLLRSVDDEVWLNELRADYAPTHVGYDVPYGGSNLSSRVAAFLANADDSLTEWSNTSEDYAAVNIFAQYLVGKYGEDVLKHSMQTSLTGIASLEHGLAMVGANVSFSDVVQDWYVASLINTSQPGLAYVYDAFDLTGAGLRLSSVTTSANLGASASLTISRQIEDWSGQWIEFIPTGANNDDTLTLSVTADVPVRAKAVLETDQGMYVVFNFSGSGSGVTLAIPNITDYRRISVVPVLMGKTTDFSVGASDGSYPQEPLRTYTVTAQRVESGVPIFTLATPNRVISGTLVTLTGSGFSGDNLSLLVDNVSVPATAVSDSSLTFVAPAHQDGDACLRISTDSGSSEQCGVFTYGSYTDGTLLRAIGDSRVWIINNGWRRHIVSPRIFDFYGHFGFSNIVDVPQASIDQYALSAWVRVPLTEDPTTWRIYEVNADASRHWITCADADNCGATWLSRGGNPAGIFTVNRAEMDYYSDGLHVFLQ